jgi:hypothetical protein
MQSAHFDVDKHGGFARSWRETPCASALPARREGAIGSMFLIDRQGERPVCVSCCRLGLRGQVTQGVFVCAECVRATDAHMQEIAEVVPELRDYRLKRWRTACD